MTDKWNGNLLGKSLEKFFPDTVDDSNDSVVNIWRGADYQEREVWDLLGIEFSSHPNMKRLFLWEGYPGHPLRKDYITYDQSIVTGDKK